MNGLGVSYVRMGRFDDAKPLLEKSYEWSKDTLGAHHPRTRIASQNLEHVYAELGLLIRTPAIMV
jgi:Tfp pilus assembly protein PilF